MNDTYVFVSLYGFVDLISLPDLFCAVPSNFKDTRNYSTSPVDGTMSVLIVCNEKSVVVLLQWRKVNITISEKLHRFLLLDNLDNVSLLHCSLCNLIGKIC